MQDVWYSNSGYDILLRFDVFSIMTVIGFGAIHQIKPQAWPSGC